MEMEVSHTVNVLFQGEKGIKGDIGDGEMEMEVSHIVNILFQGEKGIKGDIGAGGISATPPSNSTWVFGPKGQKGEKGFKGMMGDRGLDGDPGVLVSCFIVAVIVVVVWCGVQLWQWCDV